MSYKTLKINVSGLHCKACELLSEEKLSSLPGVKAVRVSQSRGQAEIDYSNEAPDLKIIGNELHKLGYHLQGEVKKESDDKKQKHNWQELGLALLIAAALGLVLKFTGWSNWQTNFNSETLNFGGVWLVGLIAGISTCMALVGGIVMALAADYTQRHPEASATRKFLPHIYFNLGRIGGFFLLGGLLGSLGSVLKISPLGSAWLSLFIGLLIIFLGLQIIDIFPALRRFSFTLPKSVAKFIPTNTKNRHYRPTSALIAGALSFFLPCGFTQSMQIFALSSGTFWGGAMIMGFFALGTTVGLLSLGGLVSLIKGKRRGLFLKTAGLIVIVFGIFNFSNAYRVLRINAEANPQINSTEESTGEVQVIQMIQGGNGYTPNNFEVEVNRPVRWEIKSTVPYSCASSLVVPAIGVNRQLEKGINIIEFTPTKVGSIKFSCSMGMYSGVINVVSKVAGANNTKDSGQNNSSPTDNALPVCNINGCQ